MVVCRQQEDYRKPAELIDMTDQKEKRKQLISWLSSNGMV